MKTYVLRFVPHPPAVEFSVKAKSLEDAVKKAERQIRQRRGPVFTALKRALRLTPLIAPCPCREPPLEG